MANSKPWATKLAGLVPVLVVSSMLLAACGGTAATPTTAPQPTNTVGAMMETTPTTDAMMMGKTATAGAGMMMGETATAGAGMMMGETATAGMMAGETATAGMMAGETATVGAMMSPIEVTMNVQNGSNQSGTATLTDMGNGMVKVVVAITGPGSSEPQPAHIHKGTCATLDPTPAYPLTNVVDGKSETEVAVSMDELTKEAYAINIHKSAAEVSTYVSCGDIKAGGAMMSGDATPGAGMSGSGAMMVPTGAANLTLWHGYTGAEADTLTKAIQQLATSNPDFKVTVLAVPFDQLKNKFTTEAATGGGPDVVIGPPDWLGELVGGGIVADLGGMEGLSTMTADLVPTSLDIAKFDGKQYGITANLKNVALYYNSDLVKSVPKDTDALLSEAAGMMSGNVKYGLALNAGFYHAVGYNFAFGGKLFDGATKVDLTQQGTVDWLNWLKKAKDSPGVFAKGGADGDIDNLFKTGAAAMVINGPWALGDYQKALGKDKVKVAVAPNTPSGGKFAPFVGGDIYYISAASKDQKNALNLIGFMLAPGIQQMFVNDAGQISTNTKVDLTSNPSLQGFIDQSKQGTPFPNIPAMGKVWDPAGNMITEVMDGKSTAEEAAKKANDAINAAIAAGQ